MVLYFTGTGNSRFVAGRIAEAIGDTAVDAAQWIRKGESGVFLEPGPYVFVSPIYVAAPPRAFLDFIRRSVFPEGSGTYFVLTCSGGMGAAPVYCRKLSEEKGLRYLGAAQIKMPQNYLVYFKTFSAEENRKKIQAALPEIDALAVRIGREEAFDAPEIKFYDYPSTQMILAPYYRWFIGAKQFRATDACIGCGKCAAVCPLGNIRLNEHRPVWGSNCTHCMGCINLCPKEAVEYGKRTKGKLRYHGPDALVKQPART